MGKRKENHIAIIAAAIAFWLFGALWFNLLGGPWLALVGKTEAEVQRYGMIPFIAATGLCWIAAYGVANIMTFHSSHSPVIGAKIGFFVSVCFFAALSLMNFLFEGRPIGLFLIEGGYGVIGVTLMGAIIGAMRAGKPA
jgi:hypothetical protein